MGKGRKRIIFYSLLAFLVMAFCLPGAIAQPPLNKDVYYDQVNSDIIKTVTFTRAGAPASYPIIALNSGDRLSLQFDMMTMRPVNNLQFTIEHCDMNWKNSNLLQSDYISGLFQDYISGFSLSAGTYAKYAHYKLDFPSYNMQPKISGNYILKVFTNDPDKPLIIRRFYVYEQTTQLDVDVHRPSYAQYRDRKQEIDLNVNTMDLPVVDPFREIFVVLKKNWRWDNEISDLKPTYVRDRQLVYNYEEGNLFDGGNEFRAFDTRDLRFKGVGIRGFTFDSLYNATLLTDEDRSYNAYNTYVDQDGGFTIATRSGDDASTIGDYVNVNFRLRPSYSDDGKDVYIFGALTNWTLDPKFKLNYSTRDGYQCTALLKQGYYDYEYVKVNEKGEIDETVFEGSHWETENNYTVFVYFHSNNILGDRLVGMVTKNTAIGSH